MDKGEILFVVFMVILLIICSFYAWAVGRQFERTEILSELCGETEGKYEFCVEKKTWEIKNDKN